MLLQRLRDLLRRGPLSVSVLLLAALVLVAKRYYAWRFGPQVGAGSSALGPLLKTQFDKRSDFARVLFRAAKEAAGLPNGMGVIHDSITGGKADVVLITRPRDVQQLLTSCVAHNLGPLKEATQSFIGRNALFALEGEEWRLHRSVLRAVLTPEVVSAHMAAHFEAVSFRLASKLGDYAKAAPIVDMHEVFCRYHVASVTSAFLENDLGFFHGGLLGGKEHAEICSAFEFLLRELPQQTSSVFTQEWREQARQARAEIEALIRGRGGAPPVLELLEAQYAGAPGRDALVDSLVGDVLQLCFAGYNTECVTLSFTLFYLAQHPLWLAEVQREVDAQLRTHDFARGAALDVEGLRVLRACFCEALRLVPPTIFTARRTGEPMTFAGDGAAGGGFALPPGTDVFVPIVFTGQDPAVWGEDWDRFNPGRWLAAPEAGARGPPGAFIPFGAGPRACLGEGFAHAASATCLAVLLYFFSFEVPPGARQEPRWTGYGVRPFDAGLGRVAMSLRVVKRNRPRRSGAVVVAAAGGRKLGG